MPNLRRSATGCTGLAATLVLLGCSNEKEQIGREIAAMNTSNIQRISNIYAAYQNAKNGKGPKDEVELKGFIKEYDPFKVASMGFDANNLDKSFTSERDGAAFKIRYNVGGGRGSADAVVFEATGKDGKKQVGYTGGKVEEVDDATYQALWSGKKPAGSADSKGGPPSGAPDPKNAAGGRPSGAPAGAPTGPPK